MVADVAWHRLWKQGYRLHDRGEHPDLIVHAMNKNRLLKDSSLGAARPPPPIIHFCLPPQFVGVTFLMLAATCVALCWKTLRQLLIGTGFTDLGVR